MAATSIATSTSAPGSPTRSGGEYQQLPGAESLRHKVDERVNEVAHRSFGEKVLNTLEGIYKSKVFRAVLITTVALVLIFAVSNPIGWMASAITIVSLATLKFILLGVIIAANAINYKAQQQKMDFEISSFYRLCSAAKNCDEIPLTGLHNCPENAGIYLGPLPNQNSSYMDDLMREKGGKWAVLSVNEPFEREIIGASVPFTEQDWNKRGVAYKALDADDHKPLTTVQMNEAAEWINQQILAGEKVYVHCRGGVGRSATAIAAYMMKYGKQGSDNLPLDEICFRIKENRKGAKATIWDKLTAIRDYNTQLKINRPDSDAKFNQMVENLDAMIKNGKKPKSSKKDVIEITDIVRKRLAPPAQS